MEPIITPVEGWTLPAGGLTDRLRSVMDVVGIDRYNDEVTVEDIAFNGASLRVAFQIEHEDDDETIFFYHRTVTVTYTETNG